MTSPATEPSPPTIETNAASGATVAVAPAAQQEPEPPGMAGGMLSTATALGFVLALAYLALWCLKRLQAGKAGGAARAADDRPRVLHTVALGRAERLVAVRYRGREYLLGVAERSVSLIEALPAASTPQAGEGPMPAPSHSAPTPG